MARKCFMCGREISTGILCEKCDKPRKPKAPETKAAAPVAPEPPAAAPTVRREPAAPAPPSSPEPPRPAASASSQQPITDRAHALDAFPEAPLLKFPVEAASPAITSVVNILVAAGVPSILLGPDRTVKFVSDEARRLFDAPQSDLNSLKYIESQTGIRVGELSVPASAGFRLRERNFIFSLVPVSGGASGAVLMFRAVDGRGEANASFLNYLREAVFTPLRSLREALLESARSRPDDALLSDAAGTLDQVVSALEMAPDVEEGSPAARPVPTVSQVVRKVAERFVPFADMKGIKLQVDAQDLDERLADHEQLDEALSILADNALHYVPAGGQVVIGVRWMEHKGKPLLLFFVIDNGPVVPESLRQVIFEPSFVWNPSAVERTGRGLFKTREFAVRHAGSVWVESKTGKACTFFLRVRPDTAR